MTLVSVTTAAKKLLDASLNRVGILIYPMAANRLTIGNDNTVLDQVGPNITSGNNAIEIYGILAQMEWWGINSALGPNTVSIFEYYDNRVDAK